MSMATNKPFKIFKIILIFIFRNSTLSVFRRVRKLPPEEVLVNSLSTSFLTEKPENDLAKLEFVYRLIQLVNYIKSLKGSSN